MLLPILLLLSACRSQAGEEDEQGGASPAPAGVDENSAAPGDEAARLQALVGRVLPAALGGDREARTRNLKSGIGGSACGEVASKATGGGFRPFLVTPDETALVAKAPAIAFDDPQEVFADAWIRWCATPEDLQRLAPALREAAANVVEITPVVDGPPDLPSPAAEAELQPPEAPRPPARKPPPPPEIDSFFNSVDRPGQ